MIHRVFRASLLACLTPLVLSAAPEPRIVLVKPIVYRNDQGAEPAKYHLPMELFNRPYLRGKVRIRMLDPAYVDSTADRNGKRNVDLIVADIQKRGLAIGGARVSKMMFVRGINGRPAPNGLSQTPGTFLFIAQADKAPPGQDAFVLAHELGHNFGLQHAVDDPQVPNDVPNIMGDGDYLKRIGPDGINDHQFNQIRNSPLALRAFACLGVEEAREAHLDETFEPYFSLLQKREVTCLTDQSVSQEDLEEIRDEARRRWKEAVIAFTPEEEEALRWYVTRAREKLGKDYPIFLEIPWQFIKVRSSHCGGLPHTRGLWTVLPENFVQAAVKARARDEAMALSLIGRVLVHEQIHVLQRLFPERFAKLYTTVFGFRKAVVTEHPWVTPHVVHNPDGVRAEWIVPAGQNGPDSPALWPQTLLRRDAEIPRPGQDFEGYCFPVKRQGDRYQLIEGAGGSPERQKLDPQAPFFRRFAIPTGHDHPAEVAAYLFDEILWVRDILKNPVPELTEEQAKVYEAFKTWCATWLR